MRFLTYLMCLVIDAGLILGLATWRIPDSPSAETFSVIVTVIAIIIGIGVWFVANRMLKK